MPSKRRLLLCRLGFIVLCVVPTMIVATGIALPHRRQPWEDRTFQHLGLTATIGQVSRPRPNSTLLQGVVLADPEVGNVANVRAVEIDESAETLRLSLVHPEVRADRLDLICRSIQQRLLRKKLLATSIEADCRQLTLLVGVQGADPRPIATFADVKCRIAGTAKGSILDMRFSLPGNQPSRPCQLTIERQSTADGDPTVVWLANTHGCFVPCQVISAVFPPLGRLGSDCHFRGSIRGVAGNDGWTGSVRGEFAQVDLYRLVQEQFLHTLDGMADITLTQLDFRGSKIVAAQGRLRSARGVIGNSLLRSAAEHLGCRLENGLTGTATRFSAIDFEFDVATDVLTLHGRCKAQPTTMIQGALGEPLLDEPAIATQLAALARTLVPHSDFQVPLTRETSKLLSLFPIPSLQHHGRNQAPRAVLRLE